MVQKSLMLMSKLCCGTSKTKAGPGGLVRVALVWRSHCALAQQHVWFFVPRDRIVLQSEPSNSNSVFRISRYLELKTIFLRFPHRLFRTPAISNDFSFPLLSRNSGVQLYFGYGYRDSNKRINHHVIRCPLGFTVKLNFNILKTLNWKPLY